MTDYNKLKVSDLKELLSQRQLPTTGKKDELISRLTADDAAKAASSEPAPEPTPPSADPAPATVAPAVEKKEIKQDTSAVAPATTTSTNAAAQGERKKFTFKRLADEFEQPPAASTVLEAEAKPVEEPAAPTEPAESFAAGLASTDVDAELERRKKRAARFGVPVSDSIKLAERAKRFGAEEDSSKPGSKSIQAIDSALGENRGKKRGPETRIQNEPPKKSKDTGKPAPATKGILTDPTEKAKAEARAKRFGGS